MNRKTRDKRDPNAKPEYWKDKRKACTIQDVCRAMARRMEEEFGNYDTGVKIIDKDRFAGAALRTMQREKKI
jgi:hypothetical protein